MKKITAEEIFAGLVLTGLVTATACLLPNVTGDGRRYLVVDKGDNKIIFEDIDSRHTRRVMDYDLDSVGLFNEYYDYINVGDTLMGMKMHNDLIMPPFYYSTRPAGKVNKISTINGKYAPWIISQRAYAARYDSIMNTIKTKQK